MAVLTFQRSRCDDDGTAAVARRKIGAPRAGSTGTPRTLSHASIIDVVIGVVPQFPQPVDVEAPTLLQLPMRRARCVYDIIIVQNTVQSRTPCNDVVLIAARQRTLKITHFSPSVI